MNRKSLTLPLIILFSLSLAVPTYSLVYGAGGSWSTRDQMIAYYLNLQTQYPQYGSISIIGHSVKGLPIYMLSLGNQNAPESKTILITCTQHGIEFVGTEAIYQVALWILTNNSALSNSILSTNKLQIIFIVNMDEYRIRQWNADGVNLNRNYPIFWGYWDTKQAFPIGKYPLSEPEAQAVNSMQATKPAWYVDIHDGGAEYLPPFDSNGNTVNKTFYYNKIYGMYSTATKQLSAKPLAYMQVTTHGGLNYKNMGGMAYTNAFWQYKVNSITLEISTNQSPSYSALPSITARITPLVVALCEDTWLPTL